eukprot:360591-Chlamydomonas_euryale.AAC.4
MSGQNLAAGPFVLIARQHAGGQPDLAGYLQGGRCTATEAQPIAASPCQADVPTYASEGRSRHKQAAQQPYVQHCPATATALHRHIHSPALPQSQANAATTTALSRHSCGTPPSSVKGEAAVRPFTVGYCHTEPAPGTSDTAALGRAPAQPLFSASGAESNGCTQSSSPSTAAACSSRGSASSSAHRRRLPASRAAVHASSAFQRGPMRTVRPPPPLRPAAAPLLVSAP